MFGEVALKGGRAVTNQLKVIDLAAERTARKLDSIPDEVNTEVDADTDKAESKINTLIRRIGILRAGILTLGPTVTPALASVGLAAGGLGASFAAAGAGVASFAAIAIPSLNGIFEASEEVEKINEKLAKADTAKERAKAMKELQTVYSDLTAKERDALKAFQDFKSFWDGFVQSLQNPILDMFIKGLGTLKTALNQLRPLFKLSINAVSLLFERLDKAMKSDQMQNFINFLTRNAGTAILNFGTIFGNIFQGIMNILMAFEPVSTDMQNGLVGLSQRFAEWTEGLAKSQGFKDFVAYVQENGPKLLTILGQVADIIGKLIVAMAPLAPVVLDIVTQILGFIQWLLELHPAVGVILVGIAQLAGAFRLVTGIIGLVVGAFTRLRTSATTTGTLLNRLITGIRTFATNLSTALRSGLSLLVNGLRLLGSVIIQLTSGALRMLVSGFRRVITVFNLLRVAFMTNPFALIITAVVLLVAIIILNWDKIKNYLIPLWNKLKSVASSVWNALKNAVSSAVQSVTNFVQNAWNKARSVVSGIWNGLRSTASSVFNSIRSTITNIWNRIKSATTSAWTSIKSTISNGISSAWSTVKGYAGRFLDAGKALLDSLAQGIRKGISKAIDAVKSGMSKIRSYLPFSPAKEGPLRDLDKSGESFFPTWAQGIERGSRPMLRNLAANMSRVQGVVTGYPGGSVSGMAMSTPGGVIINITGNNFNIREESDIRRVAEELYVMFQKQLRGSGRRIK